MIVMRKIAVALGALISIMTTVGAFAAPVPKKVQITDPANDANYLNDQAGSFYADVDAGDVPAGNALTEADILKVWFTHTAKTLTVHFQTAAPLPGPVPLFFMVKSNPLDEPGLRNGCALIHAWVDADGSHAAGGDCRIGSRDAKVTFGELPDGTGILEITIVRTASIDFMPGNGIVAPRALSQHRFHDNGPVPSVNLPVIDNTKPGSNYKFD